jgi:acetyl esterase/lipase
MVATSATDWWPEEYEPLRAEARGVAIAAAAAFAGQMDGLDGAARLARGRHMLEAQLQDAPGGRDETVAGVPCRVFDPAGEGRAGTYLQIHGGAMMWGHPRMNDDWNARVAQQLGVRVVSPDYRLAPEHPFPAAADDCLAVARWVLDHEPGPVAIGGESAGAHLSVVTLLRVRDELGASDRIGGANLIFGAFDLSGTPSGRGVRASDLPELLEGLAPDVREAYLPGRSIEEARDPAVSPLYADLHGMPPALFTVGAADRLLDDSLFMSARWQAFGNEAELAVYPDCAHGFTFFPVELARLARERIEEFLAHVLTGEEARRGGRRSG